MPARRFRGEWQLTRLTDEPASESGAGRRHHRMPVPICQGRRTRYPGLFTFSNSPKHLALYQKYGFHPRFLTLIMSKAVADHRDVARWSCYSELSAAEQKSNLDACRGLTDGILEGLDVEREIVAVQTQGLGDTVLRWEGSRLVGFAVCQCGPGSEGGSDVCYVKF